MAKGISSRYNFYVDMSGQPYQDDLFIGGVFVNELFDGHFIKGFYKEFPELRSFKKKATNLSEEKLRGVMDYLEKKKVKSVCIKFHKYKLNKLHREILERKNKFRKRDIKTLFKFKEKIIGILYYYLIKPIAWSKWHYGFEACIESHMDIHAVLGILNNLSHRDGYLLHPRYNIRRIQHMLKFADFVAGAGRKLSDDVLSSYKYLRYSKPDIDEYDSDKVFGIKKDKYKKSKI